MKKAILILSISLLAFSCEKTYQCTVTTVTTSEYYNGTIVSTVEFKGSKEEMKQQEGTTTKEFYPDGTQTTTVECK